MTLPGPSRTIIVEPVEVPADPQRLPDPEPAEQPLQEPDREPVPVAPEREREKTPA